MPDEQKVDETVQTDGEKKPFKARGEFVELRKIEGDRWIWVLWSQNGRTLAVSGNTYTQRNDAQQGLETTLEILRDPKLRVLVAA